MGKGVIDADDPHALFTAGLRAQDYPQGSWARPTSWCASATTSSSGRPRTGTPAATGAIICIDTVAAEVDEHYVPDVELTGEIAHDPDPPRKPGLGQAAGTAGGAALPRAPAAGARAGLRRRLPGEAAAGAARPARGDGPRRRPHLGRRRAQALGLAPLAGAPAEHRPDLERRRRDGLRRAGGDRRQARAPAGAARRHHLRRRRLPDERPGARDRQAARARDREPRVDGQRVRRHRAAPDAQVRAAGRHEVHEPRPGRAGGVVRAPGAAGRVGRGARAHAAAGVRARHVVVVEIPIDYRENARFSERIGDIRRVEEGVA